MICAFENKSDMGYQISSNTNETCANIEAANKEDASNDLVSEIVNKVFSRLIAQVDLRPAPRRGRLASSTDKASKPTAISSVSRNRFEPGATINDPCGTIEKTEICDQSKPIYSIRKSSKLIQLPSRYQFGPIPGIPVGSWWSTINEIQCVHHTLNRAIHGTASVGTYSMLLNTLGGPEGRDDGEQILLCLGGNMRVKDMCLNTLRGRQKALAQNCNAKLDCFTGNASMNWQAGKPIRLIRSYQLKTNSIYAPRNGYRYDGIYKVISYKRVLRNARFFTWLFILQRDDESPAPWFSMRMLVALDHNYFLTDKSADGCVQSSLQSDMSSEENAKEIPCATKNVLDTSERTRERKETVSSKPDQLSSLNSDAGSRLYKIYVSDRVRVTDKRLNEKSALLSKCNEKQSSRSESVCDLKKTHEHSGGNQPSTLESGNEKQPSNHKPNDHLHIINELFNRMEPIVLDTSERTGERKGTVSLKPDHLKSLNSNVRSRIHKIYRVKRYNKYDWESAVRQITKKKSPDPNSISALPETDEIDRLQRSLQYKQPTSFKSVRVRVIDKCLNEKSALLSKYNEEKQPSRSESVCDLEKTHEHSDGNQSSALEPGNEKQLSSLKPNDHLHLTNDLLNWMQPIVLVPRLNVNATWLANRTVDEIEEIKVQSKLHQSCVKEAAKMSHGMENYLSTQLPKTSLSRNNSQEFVRLNTSKLRFPFCPLQTPCMSNNTLVTKTDESNALSPIKTKKKSVYRVSAYLRNPDLLKVGQIQEVVPKPTPLQTPCKSNNILVSQTDKLNAPLLIMAEKQSPYQQSVSSHNVGKPIVEQMQPVVLIPRLNIDKKIKTTEEELTDKGSPPPNRLNTTEIGQMSQSVEMLKRSKKSDQKICSSSRTDGKLAAHESYVLSPTLECRYSSSTTAGNAFMTDSQKEKPTTQPSANPTVSLPLLQIGVKSRIPESCIPSTILESQSSSLTSASNAFVPDSPVLHSLSPEKEKPTVQRSPCQKTCSPSLRTSNKSSTARKSFISTMVRRRRSSRLNSDLNASVTNCPRLPSLLPSEKKKRRKPIARRSPIFESICDTRRSLNVPMEMISTEASLQFEELPFTPEVCDTDLEMLSSSSPNGRITTPKILLGMKYEEDSVQNSSSSNSTIVPSSDCPLKYEILSLKQSGEFISTSTPALETLDDLDHSVVPDAHQLKANHPITQESNTAVPESVFVSVKMEVDYEHVDLFQDETDESFFSSDNCNSSSVIKMEENDPPIRKISLEVLHLIEQDTWNLSTWDYLQRYSNSESEFLKNVEITFTCPSCDNLATVTLLCQHNACSACLIVRYLAKIRTCPYPDCYEDTRVVLCETEDTNFFVHENPVLKNILMQLFPDRF